MPSETVTGFRSRNMARLKIKRYGPKNPRGRILLVAPRQPDQFWSLQGAVDLFGAKTLMPNAALATLMALTPEDVSVEYALCDENIGKIDLDRPWDLVAVTGTTAHRRRIEVLCNAFKQRGVPVALGGPFASVHAERCRELCDHLFIGEAEYTWPRFLRDWTGGNGAGAVYLQDTQVDLADSPAPDWSLIKASDYQVMSVQTSRGCPNNCDFCDVIRYIGRGYRKKGFRQVLTEVKAAHAKGARTVFLSDDNFVGDKKFAKLLLTELWKWNSVQKRPLSFSTQATVEVGDDEDMLRLMSDVRLGVIFLGVETVRRESLAEVHKTHNLAGDLRQRLVNISRYGIVPFMGMVVGFDHDDATVFDEIYQFLEDVNALMVSLSMLNAPLGTKLHDRLLEEGRLVEGDFEGEWHAYTNIVPKQMTRDELISRHEALFRRIYEPRAFDRRLERWLEGVEHFGVLYGNKKNDMRQLLAMYKFFVYLFFKADKTMRSLFLKNIRRTWRINPRLMRRTFMILGHFRHYCDFCNYHLGK